MDFISILFYILGKCLVKINFLSNISFTNKRSYDIIYIVKNNGGLVYGKNNEGIYI